MAKRSMKSFVSQNTEKTDAYLLFTEAKSREDRRVSFCFHGSFYRYFHKKGVEKWLHIHLLIKGL